MKKDAKKNIQEIDKVALNQLIERVEHALEHDLALSVEDIRLLLTAILTLSTLQEKIEQDDVTLYKLRKLLGIVKQSESRRAKKSRNKKDKPNNSVGINKNKKEKKKPQVVYHKIVAHKSGELCPDCGRGKLYKHEPGKLLRITGHAPLEAIQHITEQLRCNGCQGIYKAPLPAEVLADGDSNQMYGYSARSVMVIHKFYSGS